MSKAVVGLELQVFITGIIFALFFIILYLGSTGGLQKIISIQGGVELAVELDDSGSKALAVARYRPGELTVMEIAGRLFVTQGRPDSIGTELKGFFSPEGEISGIAIKDASGNKKETVGKPVTGIEMTVPIPGGLAIILEVS